MDSAPSKRQCPSCGGQLAFNPGTKSTECPFCGTAFPLAENDDRPVLPTGCDRIVPFKTTLEEYQKALLSWLGEGDYVPDDIYRRVEFVAQKGLYLPVYRTWGTFDVSFTCDIGYEREEQYFVEEYDSQLKRTKQVAKTRTVIDWHPHSGNSSGKFNVGTLASSYFQRLGKGRPVDENGVDLTDGKNEIAALPGFVERHSLGGEPVDYAEPFTHGFEALPFEMDADTAYETRAKSQVNGRISAVVHNQVSSGPKTHVRNLNWSGNIRHRMYSCYAPFWCTKYTYGEEAFINLCPGAGKKAMNGSRPFAREQRKTVSKFFLPVKIVGAWAAVITFLGITDFFSGRGKGILNMSLGTYALLALLPLGIAALYGILRRKRYLEASKTAREEGKAKYASDPAVLFARRSAKSEQEIQILPAIKKWSLTAKDREKNVRQAPLFNSRISIGLGAFMLGMCVFMVVLMGPGTPSAFMALLFLAFYGAAGLSMLVPIKRLQKTEPGFRFRQAHPRQFRIMAGLAAAMLATALFSGIWGGIAAAKPIKPRENAVTSEASSGQNGLAQGTLYDTKLAELSAAGGAEYDWDLLEDQPYADIGLVMVYSPALGCTATATEQDVIKMAAQSLSASAMEALLAGQLPAELAPFTALTTQRALLHAIPALHSLLQEGMAQALYETNVYTLQASGGAFVLVMFPLNAAEVASYEGTVLP